MQTNSTNKNKQFWPMYKVTDITDMSNLLINKEAIGWVYTFSCAHAPSRPHLSD